jgi:cytochrome c peroxidase
MLRILLLTVAVQVAYAQDLDRQLAASLSRAGFTGTVGLGIEARLGRPIDPKLANLGRLLFFDKIQALHDDNTCAGCHSPTNGFGDTNPLRLASRITTW